MDTGWKEEARMTKDDMTKVTVEPQDMGLS